MMDERDFRCTEVAHFEPPRAPPVDGVLEANCLLHLSNWAEKQVEVMSGDAREDRWNILKRVFRCGVFFFTLGNKGKEWGVWLAAFFFARVRRCYLANLQSAIILLSAFADLPAWTCVEVKSRLCSFYYSYNNNNNKLHLWKKKKKVQIQTSLYSLLLKSDLPDQSGQWVWRGTREV